MCEAKNILGVRNINTGEMQFYIVFSKSVLKVSSQEPDGLLLCTSTTI